MTIKIKRNVYPTIIAILHCSIFFQRKLLEKSNRLNIFADVADLVYIAGCTNTWFSVDHTLFLQIPV